MLPEEREYVEKQMDIWGDIFKKDFDSGKIEKGKIEPKTLLLRTAKVSLRVKRFLSNYYKTVGTGMEEMDEVEISTEDMLEIEEIIKRRLKDLKF
jgi:hypothetical protein